MSLPSAPAFDAVLAEGRLAYDAWHNRFDVDSEVGTPWHRLLLSHLQISQHVAGKRVLEIACGRGGLACRLAQASEAPGRIVAADFSLTAVTKGKGFATDRQLRAISWAVGDAQALSFADNTFDSVISCETLEHLAHPRAALAELHRVLKPGGRLFLTTPSYLGMLGLYRVYLRLVGRRFTEEGQPVNRFLVAPLTLLWIRRAGFRSIRFDSAGQYLPWPGRVPIRLRALESWPAFRWFGLHTLVVAEKPRT